MCGRARCSLAPDHICQKLHVPPDQWVDQEKYNPSYNMSPGAWTPVLKSADEGLQLHTMKWGLVPSFTKHGERLDHYRMFNARSETVASKGVFSRLLPQKRCVVLMNGFYEWKAEGSKKQPYYISFGEDAMLMMAGLYDCYTDETGAALHTYTIITVDSSKPLTWLHDRMPALLSDQDAANAWLQTPADSKEFNTLINKCCQPFSGSQLTWWPVTLDMNKPGYDKADACKDVRQKKGTMSSFFKPISKQTLQAAAKPSQTQKAEKRNIDAVEEPGAEGVPDVKKAKVAGEEEPAAQKVINST